MIDPSILKGPKMVDGHYSTGDVGRPVSGEYKGHTYVGTLAGWQGELIIIKVPNDDGWLSSYVFIDHEDCSLGLH